MSNIVLPLDDIYAPIADDLRLAVRQMDDELESSLPFVNELCDSLRGFRGKMLRPALLLLVGDALGGVNAAHVRLAAVVEMVHLATLVHDDVLDESAVRRRRSTINALHGNEAAVMLGDYLISHAFHLCSSLEDQHASRLIGATTNTVCEGELLQIHCRNRLDLGEKDYHEIIRRKTAALTAAACVLGARYAQAPRETIAAMHRYGEAAGNAFQIVDDCLDLSGDEAQMGKAPGRDLEMGELTLPVIHGLANTQGTDREQLVSALRDGGPAARRQVQDRLRRSGSFAYAMETAERCVRAALDELAVLPEGPARASLTALTEFILQRDV